MIDIGTIIVIFFSIVIKYVSIYSIAYLPEFICYSFSITLVNIFTFFFPVIDTQPGSINTAINVIKRILKDYKLIVPEFSLKT